MIFCICFYLGYAAPCRYDQYDRPILGYINMCPFILSTELDEAIESTISHEIAHALGFTSSTWANMRESDGITPRTPRNENGDVDESMMTCSNGESTLMKVPSNETTLWSGVLRNVPNSHALKTPAVLAAARKQAGCPTLMGAQLDNTPAHCMGSHLEERVYQGDLMTSIVDAKENRVSLVTLAVFEDMGW